MTIASRVRVIKTVVQGGCNTSLKQTNKRIANKVWVLGRGREGVWWYQERRDRPSV